MDTVSCNAADGEGLHSLSAAFLFVPRKNAMWKFDLTYKLVCCIIFGELRSAWEENYEYMDEEL